MVRLNDSNVGASDFTSLEYTGQGSSSVHWPQLVNMQMFATRRAPPAGVPRRVVGDEQRLRGVVEVRA